MIVFKINKMIQSRKGFTLIELLVVIAIIGVLSGIVLVSLAGARSKARDAKRQSDIRQISLAQEMYYDTIEGYAVIAVDAGRLTTTAIGTLDPLPKDSGSGKVIGCNDTKDAAYKGFASDAGEQKYCIYACLEGGNFFAASEKGTTILTTEPTDVDCW